MRIEGHINANISSHTNTDLKTHTNTDTHLYINIYIFMSDELIDSD